MPNACDNWWARLIVGVIALVSLPSSAHAFSLDDVMDRLPHALALRAATRGIVGGAASSFREEAEKLIDDKIDPMLDRVDSIIRLNITNAANEAIRVLDKAEAAMNSVIENVHKVGIDLISTFFDNLKATLANVIRDIDDILTKVLCKLAPAGKGLVVTFSPLPGYDEIRVWYPAKTQCWRRYLTSSEHPMSRVFDGWQAYRGLICEERFALNDIHADDPDSIARTAEKYSRLVAITAAAQCTDKPDVDQESLMTMRQRFERKTRFYRGLAGISEEER